MKVKKPVNSAACSNSIKNKSKLILNRLKKSTVMKPIISTIITLAGYMAVLNIKEIPVAGASMSVDLQTSNAMERNMSHIVKAARTLCLIRSLDIGNRKYDTHKT